MSDIKFQCPECRQKIAVDEGAAGLPVDCPNCRSSLVIPLLTDGPVEIVVRRRLVALVGPVDSAYEELERKHRELAVALDEAAKLRADTERSRVELIKLRDDLAATVRERDGLRAGGPEQHQTQLVLDELRAELQHATAERDTFRTAARQTEAELRQIAEQARAETGPLGLVPGHGAIQEKLIAGETERAELRAQLAEARGHQLQWVESQDEIARLQEQVRSLTSERDDTRTQLSERENELGGVRETLAAARTDGEKLSADREAARQKIGDLEKLLETNAHALASQKSELHTVQRELEELSGQLAAITADRDEARQQLADREDALRTASLTMQAAKNEFDRTKQEATEAAAEQERLKSALAEATEEAKDLQQRVDSLLDDLHRRESELANAQQKIENSGSGEAQLRQQIAAQEAGLQETGRQAAELERKCAEQRKALAEAASLQAKLRAEAVAIGGQKVESDRRAASLLAELQRAQKDAGDLRLNWQTGRSDREQLVDKLSIKETEIRELEARLEQQMELEKSLLAKTEDAVKGMVAAQEKSQTLAGECDRLSAQLARVNTELGAAHEQLRQTRHERETMRSSVGSVQIELEQGLDQLHAVESERDALKMELEAVKAGLERAKQHVNVLQSRRDQMRDEIAKLRVALGQAPDAMS